MLAEGNYDNCVLKDAVTTESQGGNPMMVLTFDVGGGTTRNVRFMLNDDNKGKDGKTNLERSGEQLDRHGFNGDFSEPKFNDNLYSDGITLRCKHGEYNGKPQEEWSLGFDFKYEKAADNSLQALNRNYRARFGASPKPSTPSGKAPPARTPPSRTPPAKKAEPSDDMTDTSGVTDMDTAFKYVMKHNPNLSDDEWQNKVLAQEKKSKRKEDAFTAEDWQAVASDCVVPF